MAEIAEVCKAHAAIAKDSAGLLPIKTRRRQSKWSVTNKEQNQQSSNDCQQRDEDYVGSPVVAADAIDQIRRRFPERKRPHQNSECQAATVTKPRGENFHRRRIDSGQKHARQKSQQNPHRRIMRKQSECAVDQSARDRGQCKKMTGTDDVGKICQRTQKRAGYETKLDREREPTCRCFAQIPFLRQRRHYGRTAEPKRHTEQ